MKIFSHRGHRDYEKKAISFFTVLSVVGFCLFFVTSCSIPNLEKPECTEARDAVKQFYSFHFGNDMHPTAENLKMQERYLTENFYKKLMVDATGLPPTKIDYFTLSEEPPKTFKIGKCEAPQTDKVNIQVQIYWRDEAKTVQKEVNVETVRTGDSWRINKVSN